MTTLLRMVLLGGRVSPALKLSAATLGALLACAGAMAQWRTVAPIGDSVTIRSGNGSSWYPIGTATRATILRSEGEIDGWLRVEYLPGMHVVVKTDEAEIKGDKAVITRRTRLRALSAENQVLEESFRFVCEEPVAPGTELRLIGKIKDRAGAEAGYIVEPPSCARGFVLAREVREAKPEETAPAKPAETAKPANTPPAPAPASTTPPATSTPAPAPVTTTTTTPLSATQPSGEGTNRAATSSVAQPGSSAPAGTPSGTPSGTPAPSTDGASTQNPTGEPASTVPTPAPVETPKPTGPTFRQLDRSLQDLMAKPIEEADPQELIEQFEKYGRDNADEPGASRTLALVDQRLQLLRLRQKARGLMPEIAALEERSRNAAQNYQLTIDRLLQNRQYLVAGRLLPSTVYDGDRLPQMYRLVSIDPAINRTIAYIVPSAELELEQKVGAIVGVLGDGTIEPSSLVQIIKPTVVDLLRPAEPPPPEPVR